jgi:ABC-2 type transport system permease protein
LLTKVIKNEWRNLRADRTLWALLLLFIAFIAYGIYNGNAWARQQESAAKRLTPVWDEKLAQLKQQLAEGRPSAPGFGVPVPDNPYSMSTQKVDVALPPASLAALSVGQSDLYLSNTQAYLWSNADELFAKSEPQNPVNLLAGRFDLTFVVLYIYPLVILALSFNMLSAEIEGGTLALLLSQPVSARQILVGKVIARISIVVPVLIISALMSLLVVRAPIADQGSLARFLLWSGVVIFYGLFWFGLAALINSLNRSSATNAIMLVGLWLLFVIIVPSLISTLSETVYPVPPRAELIIAGRDTEPNVRRDGERVLAKFYEDHPELRPTANAAEISEFRRQLLTTYLNDRHAQQPLVESYDRQLAGQQTFVNRLCFFSTAIIAQEAMNDIAGTGFARYRDFRAQVNHFVEANRSFYVPKIMRGEMLTLADYEGIPRFRYRNETTAQVGLRVARGLGGLLALSVLVCFAALYRLRAYSVAA